jgi:ABC-type sugar transport system substrate-binding protein
MRVVAAIFAVLAAGAFAHDAAASPQGKRVALLATLNTNPYIGAWTSTFIKQASAEGMKVTNLESPFDAALQSQQVDDAIAQKYDLIVIDYINDQAILPALTRAKAAGMPIILMATPLQKEHEDLFLSYVGTDHDELGRIAGENLVKGLAAEGKTKANVAVITGLAQQLHVQQRMAGFRAVLKDYPGIEIVAEEDGKWNTAVSEKITGQLLVRLAAKGGVDGTFAMADNQATGAIQGVVVVASNCMKDGVVHIGSGEQFSTATQIPTEEAEAAAKKVAAYFNGETLKKYEMVKSYGITSDNLGKFAKACSY